MRIKQGFLGCLAVGLAAGIIRACEYLFTIDKEGYYLHTAMASFLSGALVGLMVVGFLWSLFCCFIRPAEELSSEALIGGASHLRSYFMVVGLVTAADGISRFFFRDQLSTLAGISCLLGALGWIIASRARKPLGGAALLAPLQMIGVIIAYFWTTYKYIHISGCILETLALCAQSLITLLVMKLLAGGTTSRARLARCCCWMLLLFPAASLAPLLQMAKGVFSGQMIFNAVNGIALTLLSIQILLSLNWRATHEEPQFDLPEELNEYISELPEIDDDII